MKVDETPNDLKLVTSQTTMKYASHWDENTTGRSSKQIGAARVFSDTQQAMYNVIRGRQLYDVLTVETIIAILTHDGDSVVFFYCSKRFPVVSVLRTIYARVDAWRSMRIKIDVAYPFR